MHLLQSDNTYQELIQHMETCGYSSYHIQRVKKRNEVAFQKSGCTRDFFL